MKKLTSLQKFKIADAMAARFDNLTTVNRNVAFGVVINHAVKLNGKEGSLKDLLTYDDAVHITNLILKRVYGSIIEIDI